LDFTSHFTVQDVDMIFDERQTSERDNAEKE